MFAQDQDGGKMAGYCSLRSRCNSQKCEVLIQSASGHTLIFTAAAACSMQARHADIHCLEGMEADMHSARKSHHLSLSAACITDPSIVLWHTQVGISDEISAKVGR